MRNALGHSALLAVAACAAAEHGYLGAEAPDPCKAHQAAHCAGALAVRGLDAGEADVYDDPALRDYVQTIADRLAAGSHLVHAPRVTISDHDGTFAPFGDRIVIGRRTLERLGTEAEVAAIVAHEMVHVEGHHAIVSLFGPDADERWLAARRDSEAVADERAVALLEHAGYLPAAMPRALTAALDGDDNEHPPRAERIARVAALAAGRTEGFEGRAPLLAHEDHMVVGRDTRMGTRVGDAWVVASVGVALRLSREDIVHAEGDTLALHHGRDTLELYPVGAPWAEELASHLEERSVRTTPVGTITVGVAAEERDTAADPLARLERAIRDTLPSPRAGSFVVIAERCSDGQPCTALVIELSAHGESWARDRWLASLRDATPVELAAAEPSRITLVPAPRTAVLRDLVWLCPDPDAALALDSPQRAVAAGESIKCTDRKAPPSALASAR